MRLRAGDTIRVNDLDAVIVLNGNDRSLFVAFDGMIGGHVGSMAILEDDKGRWRALDGTPVDVYLDPLVGLEGRLVFRCQFCGTVSHHLGDMRNRYCGRCHLFHDAVMTARSMTGTHECSEWPNARGWCAVCGGR